MKIIALEEHIGSKLLGDATRGAIEASYPYYNTFLHPNPADAPSIPDLQQLGERRIKEMDEAGIDMYYPVWEALTELDLPVYIHPNYTTEDACKSYYSNLGDQFDCVLSTYGYGWHFEAGLQVVRMILAGVFEKFPTLKVISGHWGEMVPYYLPRLDQMFSPAVTGLKEVFSYYYKRNVYVTPSGLYDNDSLEYCVNKLGIDHIMFSADFPYIPMTGAHAFMENAPLSEYDKERFGSLNAENLLHLND